MLGKRRRPWILNSTPWIADSRYQEVNLSSLSEELGFWIPVIVGFRILCAVFRIREPRIPDSTSKKFRNCGFHEQNFPGFMGRHDWVILAPIFLGKIKKTKNKKRWKLWDESTDLLERFLGPSVKLEVPVYKVWCMKTSSMSSDEKTPLLLFLYFTENFTLSSYLVPEWSRKSFKAGPAILNSNQCN